MREKSSDFDDDFNLDDDYLPEERDNRWELDEQQAVSKFYRAFKHTLSKEGLEEVTIWVRIALNKHKALSNLDIREIKDICAGYSRAINGKIVINSKRWGLTNNADRRFLKEFIMELIYVHLKRAYLDGERQYRKDTYRGVKPHNEESANKGLSLRGLFGRKKTDRDEQSRRPLDADTQFYERDEEIDI